MSWQFPQRPGFGSAGRLIQVRSNFFPVQSLPQLPIHHYEVVITPEVPPVKNRRVYQLWEDEGEAEDPAQRGPKKFKLVLTKIGEINMQRLGLFLEGRIGETPVDAIVALDILLRHRPSLIYTTVGRCFYTPDSAATIANGAQLWQGFHQSIRPSQGQMLINLDVSATAFYQPGKIIPLFSWIER
ncbi:Eukaryotic translation initiation factor 2C [Cladochytrium tenue]|nr:Eukaryotic translation initiation factor 2C [Cladochytrium tenue]